MLFVPALLVLAPLVAAGPSMRRAMAVHDSREEVPTGFTLTKAASPNAVLNMRIALKEGDTDGLIGALMDVSTPRNAKYGQHLSKEEVEAFIAPKADTTKAVTDWLKSNDIAYDVISPAGDWLSISIPVSKASSLLDAQFSIFTHQETGSETIRTLEYSIPAELSDQIDVIHPTTSFPNHLYKGPIFKTPSTPSKREDEPRLIEGRSVPSSCANTITPACLQALYGIPTEAANSTTNQLLVTGYDDEYANRDDLESFLKKYRTDISSSTTFTTVEIDDGKNSQTLDDAGTEADLDVEYTIGLATGVPVSFLSVGDDYQDGDLDGFLDTVNYVLDLTTPYQVMTTSYGENENTISRSLANKLCTAYAQLGARGTSILFASGDGGVSGSQSASCSKFVPTFPSGCPYLTSVGALTGISPEAAADYSAGGFSNYFGIPSYQSSAVATYLSDLGTEYSGKYNASGRGYPDVSAQGSNFEIVNAGETFTVDGTSCASPTFASVISLLNDELITAGKSSLGFLNPWLYDNPSMLNDVTSGDNPGCDTDGFSAVAGWDPVTGLGSPNYAKMRTAAGLS